MDLSRRSSANAGFRGSSSSHSFRLFIFGPTSNTPHRVGHTSIDDAAPSASFSFRPRLMDARASAATRDARAEGSSRGFSGVRASISGEGSVAPSSRGFFAETSAAASSSESAPASRRARSSGVGSCTNSMPAPAAPPRM